MGVPLKYDYSGNDWKDGLGTKIPLEFQAKHSIEKAMHFNMSKSVNNEKTLNIKAYQYFACKEGCIWGYDRMFCNLSRVL